MATEVNDKYRTVCRVCISEWTELQNIFTTNLNGMDLAQMLSICVGSAITPNDGLPPVICSGCLINLEAAFEFQELCRTSETELRRQLHARDENEMNEGNEKGGTEEGDDAAGVIRPHSIEHTSMSFTLVATKDERFRNAQKLELSDGGTSQPAIEVNSSKGLQCNVCDKTFDRPYKLRRHSNLHKDDAKPFECPSCHKRFQTESNLLRHKVIHSVEMAQSLIASIKAVTSYKCRECDREFTKQESLAAHMRAHVKQTDAITKSFQCECCPKVFSHRNKMTRHMRVHKDGRRFVCSIDKCLHTFSSSSQLIDHLNKHKEVRPHVCDVCNKAFRQSCTLKDHMRTHSGETPFLCSQCGKAFNNSSNLRQHLIRHEGSKPYACTECPSRFSCKGGLKSHMTTHTGLKPYSCDFCGSTFTKQYSLVKHKRIHSGERPYSCEMCDMRFTSSDHVKRHMRTHTGEKPYKCKFCDRAFAQSNDLVKHLRSHVGSNTYQCTECPRAFRLLSELREHGKIHFIKGESPVTAETISPTTILVPSENVIEITDEQMEAIEKSGHLMQLIKMEPSDAQIDSKSILITPGQIIDASAIDNGTRFIVQSLDGDKVTIESRAIQQIHSVNANQNDELR